MDRGAGRMVLPLLQFRMDRQRRHFPGLLSDASVEELLAQYSGLDPFAGDIHDFFWGHVSRQGV